MMYQATVVRAVLKFVSVVEGYSFISSLNGRGSKVGAAILAEDLDRPFAVFVADHPAQPNGAEHADKQHAESSECEPLEEEARGHGGVVSVRRRSEVPGRRPDSHM